MTFKRQAYFCGPAPLLFCFLHIFLYNCEKRNYCYTIFFLESQSYRALLYYEVHSRHYTQWSKLELYCTLKINTRPFDPENVNLLKSKIKGLYCDNPARSYQYLNFGLSWPGQGQIVKAKHCQSLKFPLLCTDTALSKPSIGAQYQKQNMIKFSQCIAELAQEFKFL